MFKVKTLLFVGFILMIISTRQVIFVITLSVKVVSKLMTKSLLNLRNMGEQHLQRYCRYTVTNFEKCHRNSEFQISQLSLVSILLNHVLEEVKLKLLIHYCFIKTINQWS